MPLTNYCKVYNSNSSDAIMFSTKKASLITLPFSMVKDIEESKLTEDERHELADLGFLVKSCEAEREELRRFIDDLNQIDTMLSVKIVMNLDCNLSCNYCFEGKRKGKLYLSKETADYVVDFIKNIISARRKKELHVTFYGGEPLLSIELISYVSDRLKTSVESCGVVYNAFVITNGSLLTEKTANILKAVGVIEAAITLDGPRHIHDIFRPFKSGRGSFDDIVRNIRTAVDLLKIQIGGNFTRDNYRKMPDLLDFLNACGLSPAKIPLVRFDPIMREREDVSLDFHDGCDCYNEPEIIQATLFLREEILKRGYNAAKTMPMACLLDIADRITINYDGSIYKCPGFIGRKEFCVGDVRTGMVEDYRKSHNLDNWKNNECLNCAYLPLCFGGCRYMKFIRDGNMNGVDCRKAFFDAALETLIKQDVNYGLVARKG